MYTATPTEIKNEKEHFMVVCLIVRSDEGRYKILLDDLKSSVNRGRDEYPSTLTDAFDLLVRESGEYDTVRRCAPRFTRGRNGRGGRGRDSSGESTIPTLILGTIATIVTRSYQVPMANHTIMCRVMVVVLKDIIGVSVPMFPGAG